jgi:hypothetical protein
LPKLLDAFQNLKLFQPIAEGELSTLTRLALYNQSIITWRDLVSLTPEKILKFKNIGKTSLNEIILALNARNLDLNMNDQTFYRGQVPIYGQVKVRASDIEDGAIKIINVKDRNRFTGKDTPRLRIGFKKAVVMLDGNPLDHINHLEVGVVDENNDFKKSGIIEILQTLIISENPKNPNTSIGVNIRWLAGIEDSRSGKLINCDYSVVLLKP